MTEANVYRGKILNGFSKGDYSLKKQRSCAKSSAHYLFFPQVTSLETIFWNFFMLLLVSWLARPVGLWTSLIILILLSSTLWLLRFSTQIPLHQDQLTFHYPVAAQGHDRDMYVIDSANRRLIAAQDGRYRYQITGGDRGDDRFYFANAVFPLADGRLVLHNLVMDDNGFYVLREELLLFDANGRNRRVLFAKVYPSDAHKPSLVQRGEIFNIHVDNQSLYWFVLDEESITFYQQTVLDDAFSEAQVLWSLPFAQAIFAVASLVPAGGQSVIMTLKDGTIRYLSATDQRILFNGDPQQPPTYSPIRIVPWKLTKAEEKIIFVDLEGRRLLSFHPDAPAQWQVVMDQALLQRQFGQDFPIFNYYFVSSNNNTLYTTNDEGVLVLKDDVAQFLTGVNYTSQQKLAALLFYFLFLLWLVTLVALCLAFYKQVLKSQLSPLVWRGLSIAFLVFFIGFVSVALLLPGLSQRYQQSVLDRIAQMVQLLPQQLDGDDFHALTTQADYHSPAYQKIRHQLLQAFNFNKGQWNKGYYFALYRVMDDRLYGLMYMNGWINPYYPFDWLQGAEDPGVYDKALAGEVATELVQDVSGEWLYGVGPVYDSQGQVVAIFETGTELFAYRKANQEAITNLLLQLLTLLVAIIIFLVEVAYLTEVFRKRRLTESTKLASWDEEVVAFNRPLSFLFFVSISLSAAFLSVFSRDLYQAVPVSGVLAWLPADFLIALPLSIESFAFGLTTFFGGFLLLLLPWRPLLLLGASVSACGLYFSAVATHLELLMLGRMLIGVGSGMVYMALRSLINRVRNPEVRSQQYAHFYAGMTAGVNVGLIIGSSLADQVGFAWVFYFGALLSFVVLILTLFIPYSRRKVLLQKENPWESLKKLQPLFADQRTWFFFLLLILPTYIAGSFQQYYFPLWGDANGLSTADVGRFLLIGGLLIIYLGPWFSQLVERHLGNLYGSILGSFLWGLALIIAALSGNIFGMLLVLMLMGASEGFCVNTQNNLYLDLPVTKKVGADTAVGYFEMFAKLGETLGPLLFALALLLGSISGLLLLGVVVALLAVLILPLYARVK
jgi:predicted MFS family arabinose efflux permease